MNGDHVHGERTQRVHRIARAIEDHVRGIEIDEEIRMDKLYALKEKNLNEQ